MRSEQDTWTGNSSFQQSFGIFSNNSKSGSSVPGYAKGLGTSDVGSSYSVSEFEIQQDSLSGYSRLGGRNWRNGQNQGLYDSSCPTNIPFRPRLYDELLKSYYGALRKAASPSGARGSMGVVIAELKETAGLHKALSDSVSNTLMESLKLVKGRGSAKGLSKALSSLWLSWNFGAAPTISDLKKHIDIINQHVNRDVENYKNEQFSCSSEEYWESYRSTGGYGVAPTYGNARGNIRELHSLRGTITAGFRYPISGPRYDALSTQLGMDLTDQISTAWEVVPYSWVVDYFSNMGDILNDNFYRPTVRPFYVYISWLYRLEQQNFLSMSGGGGVDVITSGTPVQTVTGYSYNRTKMSDITPLRSLRYKAPDEIAMYGATKIANLSACLAARLK